MAEANDQMPYEQCRVLVVEDRTAMRQIVKTILKHMGFRMIDEAADGREALQKLRQSPDDALNQDPLKSFRLIISDWQMPTMDGLQLLREVRKDQALGSIPFLMLTSLNERNSIIEASIEGVTDYIVKPFPAKVLEEKIRTILSGNNVLGIEVN